ncbi:hypothetical protein BAUCODRAFT_491665 [Baudoinia panamericana UAMH 10762]|uniref:NAD(P)-binding protein n=1 Tax=Baudoinia panamericana (strain UAMH 10762) TaxID=717646 RepID=M2MZ00_BAUPA|nr:uncharacterized protein BAUCODRAFT_491665 [Baudoinia panamericana UAMH 10762]EMC96843.1 hypothetical protein BAUCODRAFT_491665 [Baudoinia panamericana UAMH 10762]
MPTFTDITRFLSCQAFGTTSVPQLNLAGKTIIVTGANTGLGFEAAKHLARMQASRLILACRNVRKGEAAKLAILKDTACGNHTSIEIWEVDLARYASVLAFGKRVRSELNRLDGFIANAGIEPSEFSLAEGLEQTLTVNVISTYLSAIVVLPKLKETAEKYGVDTRLTLVGSLIHYFAPDDQLDVTTDRDTFSALSDSKTADMKSRYPLSKLIEHLIFTNFVRQVSTSAGTHRIIINLVNPGWCASELTRYRSKGLVERLIFFMLGRTTEQGARTLVHGVTAPGQMDGQYLSECQVKPQSAFMNSDRGTMIARTLWDELVRRIKQIDVEAAGFLY